MLSSRTVHLKDQQKNFTSLLALKNRSFWALWGDLRSCSVRATAPCRRGSEPKLSRPLDATVATRAALLKRGPVRICLVLLKLS
jgi:hypothetical protein